MFYTRLGTTRGSSVTAMELAMAVNAVVALAAAALALLLPRRPGGQAPAGRPAVTQKPAAQESAEYSAGAAH